MTPHDLAEVWGRARDVMTSELRAVGGDALAAARATAMCAAVGPGWSAAGAANDTAYAAREAAAWARARAVAHESWSATDAVAREALRRAIAGAWAAGEAAEQSWQSERLLAYLTSDGLRPHELGPVEQPALAS
jgi:hypothetical protein